jgi:hypothetical protein
MHRAWRPGVPWLLEHGPAPVLFTPTSECAPRSDCAPASRTGGGEHRSSVPPGGLGRRRMDVATAQVVLVGGSMGGPALRSHIFALGLRARRRRASLVRGRNVAGREGLSDWRPGAHGDRASRRRRGGQRKRCDRKHGNHDSEARGKVALSATWVETGVGLGRPAPLDIAPDARFLLRRRRLARRERFDGEPKVAAGYSFAIGRPAIVELTAVGKFALRVE